MDGIITDPAPSYGSLHKCDGNSGPLSSSNDLGISDETFLKDTCMGKMRRLKDLKKKEKFLLLVSSASLLCTLGFSIAIICLTSINSTEPSEDPSLIVAIVILINVFFCAVYLFHGIANERPCEIIILIVASMIVGVFIIISFCYSSKDGFDTAQLVCACVFIPTVSIPGIQSAVHYYKSGEYVMKNLGNVRESLQDSWKRTNVFLDLLTLDLQFGITIVILLIVKGNTVITDTLNVTLMSGGIVLTLVWFFIGRSMVKTKNKKWWIIFWALCGLECGYHVFKIVMAIHRIQLHMSIAVFSLVSAIAAVMVNIAVIGLSVWIYRNPDQEEIRKRVYNVEARPLLHE